MQEFFNREVGEADLDQPFVEDQSWQRAWRTARQEEQ